MTEDIVGEQMEKEDKKKQRSTTASDLYRQHEQATIAKLQAETRNLESETNERLAYWCFSDDDKRSLTVDEHRHCRYCDAPINIVSGDRFCDRKCRNMNAVSLLATIGAVFGVAAAYILVVLIM